MTFYGNYDAGKPQGATTNPLVRRPEASPQNFDIKFPTTKGVKLEGNPWGLDLSSVTPEKRIAEQASTTYAALTSIREDANNDRFVDEMLAPYITPETRQRIASISFNVAMAMAPLDDFMESA